MFPYYLNKPEIKEGDDASALPTPGITLSLSRDSIFSNAELSGVTAKPKC